jgi:hypothetical protein
VDVVIGTSSLLREFSHGKDIDHIIDHGSRGVAFVQAQGVEVRFSTEDSFRSDPADLFRVYEAVDAIGVTAWASPTRSASRRRARSTNWSASCAGAWLRHRVPRAQRLRLRHRQCLTRPSTPARPTSIPPCWASASATASRPLGGLIARLYAIDPPRSSPSTTCPCCAPRQHRRADGRRRHPLQQLHHRASRPLRTRPASMPRPSSTTPRPTRSSIRRTSG